MLSVVNVIINIYSRMSKAWVAGRQLEERFGHYIAIAWGCFVSDRHCRCHGEAGCILKLEHILIEILIYVQQEPASVNKVLVSPA